MNPLGCRYLFDTIQAVSPVKNKEKSRPQRVLFIDFNGVISYDPFWVSLTNPDHPLHLYYEPIEEFLFRDKSHNLIDEWMMGKYTGEQIHRILSERLGVPYKALFSVFCQDCKKLDISKPILAKVRPMRNNWYCILKTDNMDSFHRFTLPANPELAESFDEVHISYLLRSLKKTNSGEYFVKTAANLEVDLKRCVLIDNGNSNCKLFERLGGKAYCTQNETEVISVLDSLINNPI